MGTPDFAVPALTALAEAGHEIGYVVTQPDAVRDRGKKVKMTPVKEIALKLGLNVLQPEKIKKDAEFFAALSAYEPDLIVVAAYGQILPKELLDLPKLGCVNIHGSLLPRFRGAAPIQRAILEGDEETGITLMYMEEGLDTGAMLAKRSTPIGKKNGQQLHDELALICLLYTSPRQFCCKEPKRSQFIWTLYPKYQVSNTNGKNKFFQQIEQAASVFRAAAAWFAKRPTATAAAAFS